MSSPPGQLSVIDWKSIAWTAATTALAAVITVGIEQVLPQLEQEGVLTVAVVALLTTVLHAARKWLTDTRPVP